MSQSNLYKTSGTGVAEDVNVTDDSNRALGVATVDEVSTPVDFTEDATRALGQTSVTNTVTVEQAEALDVDIGDYDPIHDSTAAAGEANAATINLGALRQNVDAWYDVSNADGEIIIEWSETPDGDNWRDAYVLDGENISTGGEAIQFETAYQYARIYAGGVYSDGDVNVLEIVSKGI